MADKNSKNLLIMMYKISFFIITSLLVSSCKQDKASETQVAKAIMDSIITDLVPIDTMALNNTVELKPQKVAGTNIQVKQTKINLDSVKKIIAEKVDDSINKGKTCESMIVEYEALIKKVVANKKDKSAIKELSEWTKDILHAQCLKTNEKYRLRKEKLDEQMVDEE
jgi:hypothetical protein